MNFMWRGDLITLIKALRRNSTEVWVTSGQKLCTKIIYIVLQTPLRLFQISSQIKKIISNNTQRRKQMLNFAWITWKYWWNETNDEILPAFAQFLWTLKFVFSRSQGKLFSVLFQATIYIFSFKKM